MKIIPRMKIDSCYNCPYCRHNPISKGYNCTNEKIPDDKMTFIISDKKLVETKEKWPKIPSWCPLEDTKKKIDIPNKKIDIPNKKSPCQFKTKKLCSRNNFKTLCSLNKNCDLR